MHKTKERVRKSMSQKTERLYSMSLSFTYSCINAVQNHLKVTRLLQKEKNLVCAISIKCSNSMLFEKYEISEKILIKLAVSIKIHYKNQIN